VDSTSDTLFRFPRNYESGDEFGYLNQRGDTVFQIGRFSHSFSDTILTYGIVVDSGSLIGINKLGQRIYEVYAFDNGPDYISDGMFRIVQDGKIGYADSTGRIVIEPQFECASPFSDGFAEVTFDCVLVTDGDHKTSDSNSWFYIDKSGKKAER
jgi:hypothetical protein